MAQIAANLDLIRNEMGEAARRAGRSIDDITLVAVSKTVGADRVSEAIDAGLQDFGENRVPDFLEKHARFPDVRWHFIGTLQSNKVKDVVGKAHLIHSVDSLKLIKKIDTKAAEFGVIQPILLQVNISGEEAKHGFSEVEAKEAVILAASCEHLALKGLMTMAPAGPPESARPIFESLCRLRDFFNQDSAFGVQLQQLSMGMSGDFAVAIEEGATLIRIGRSLFL